MIDEVLGVIDGSRFRYGNEDDLQRAIAAALTDAGLEVEREVRLTPADRIDLLVGDVGIEVKVAGRASSLERQLRRYAASDRVRAFVVVSNRALHMRLPDQLRGKPVRVIWLGGGGL